MKLVRLTNMCLTEMYRRGWVGRNLSAMFSIRNGLKQGEALLPLLFNFAFEYTIRMVQVIQNGFKLYNTHQLLVYANNVNILGGSIHTIQGNAEALLMSSKAVGLEVNVDKTKYMVMSRDQNAG
jgi:hypothetical protein